MGCCLTSWFAKKQAAFAISMTEAEYVTARKACQQALWMKQALIDYGIRLDDVLIMCDNKGAINLSKNPVQHSRTKHIEIRHYFLRDNVQKGNISIEKVASEDNIADIFTKPLKREVFIGKGIRVYKFNLVYVASIKWVVELPINARLLFNTRSETYVLASVKEIDDIQLGIISQVELKLQPRVLLQFLADAEGTSATEAERLQ
ncbi:hypothetical protein Tco_0529723 [Tanacetum coccineum]